MRRRARFGSSISRFLDEDGDDMDDPDVKKKSKTERNESVLDTWLELDITRAARRGELPGVFEVDDLVDSVCEVLSAGKRPILTGSPGCGKTSVLHAVARRALEPEHSELFGDRHVVRLSLRRKAASLKNSDQLRPEFQKLIEELRARQDSIIPFFSDFHLAYQFGLEPQFCALALRLEVPILGEGDLATTEMMILYEPELDQHYVTIPIMDPDFDRVKKIAVAWAREKSARSNQKLSDEAIDEAAHLSFRFLSRSSPLRKTIDLLSHAATLTAGDDVSAADVLDRFSASCHVPRVLVDPALPLDVDSLESDFRDRVLGQEEAVSAVISRIGIIKAGLSDMRRPFGAFLFAGPTGVGKTHLAQLLAEYLFGSRDRMLRFNMADYQGEDGGEKLFGEPDGHNLPQMRGQLTLRVMSHPFGVMLLDEFEKAHAKVHDRFFQLMDEGCFINGARETVSCRSMIIIATSNAGAEAFRNPPLGFEGRISGGNLRAHLEYKLLEIFRTEFLNRFDEIVYFHPLQRTHVRTIARRELEALEKRSGLTQRGYGLDIDESVLDWLAVHGYDPRHGARFLRRILERTVTGALAKTIVRERLEGGSRIRLAVNGGRVVATVIGDDANEKRHVGVVMPVGVVEERRRMSRDQLEAEILRLREISRKLNCEMEERSKIRDELIDAMNVKDFWKDPVASQPVLDRFRDLDVTLQSESRFASSLRAELDEGDYASWDTDEAARRVENAGRVISEWHERLAIQTSSAVWMIISSCDLREPSSEWIEDLVEMELGWCRRAELVSHVVAYAMQDGGLSKVALSADGPGAEAYLRMEDGVHRRVRAEGADLKARIEVLPARAPSKPYSGLIVDAKQHAGKFGVRISKRGRLEIRKRGLVVDFVGANSGELAHLLGDLEDAWAEISRDESVMARIYGRDGVGGLDPRSGASAARLKSVLKGELDGFLDAWRVMDGSKKQPLIARQMASPSPSRAVT